MQEWWGNLEGVTRFFYGMASFFSVFFLWQIIAAFFGAAGNEADIDNGTDISDLATSDDVPHEDALESSNAFRILSVRSIITFFTLFSWGCALYTTEGVPLTRAMLISTVWGVVGMLAVAFVFWVMGKMTESGTKDIRSCAGRVATVYLDIPADGFGEIKTIVDGVSEHVKARSSIGKSLSAGTQVRILKVVEKAWVEVEEINTEGESV